MTPSLLVLGLGLAVLPACNRNSLDDDGDGFTELTNDCDDSDPNVHPDAVEVCYNGIDDNCNGEQDEEGATSGRIWYADLDGDNFGNDAITIEACAQPENYAPNKWDCDEDDAAVNPDAEEVCDGVDNDCDGEVDETSSGDALTWFPDRDGDGYGDQASEVQACEAPPGYIAEGGDCADLDPLQSPAATEDCRTDADDDCDGTPNGPDAYGCTDFYADTDGDGFPGTAACLCEPTAEHFATEPTDCDDTRDDVYPGATVTRTFAVENCDAIPPLTLDDADHQIVLPGYTYGHGMKLFDATGDGVDDMLVSARYGTPTLLEGPVSDHVDLSAPLATLPVDYGRTGNYWFRLLPDQDGDGLEDILQVYTGNGTHPSGLYAHSSAARGAATPGDALWSLPDAWPLEGVQLAPAAHGDGVELLVAFDEPSLSLYALDAAGTAPTLLGVVEDPLGYERALFGNFRRDFDGDGVRELVVTQATDAGFATDVHVEPEGGTFVPRRAVAILEQYEGTTDPLDLQVRHIVYGWSRMGDRGILEAEDVDGDGLPDLLATEGSWMLEAQSGAVMAFTADGMANRGRLFSYTSDADAIYSGDAGQELQWAFAQADLDGDGTRALYVYSATSAPTRGAWLLDHFPMGHHRLDEVARVAPLATPFLQQGDANADGVDDFVLQAGTGSDADPYVLTFFWGETP